MAGTEVDPATGMPVSEVERPISQSTLDRLGAQKAKADQLIGDVNSERGQEIINKIHAQLASRITTLINEDGECRALKRLLLGMSVDIDMGKLAADKLRNMVIRK